MADIERRRRRHRQGTPTSPDTPTDRPAPTADRPGAGRGSGDAGRPTTAAAGPDPVPARPPAPGPRPHSAAPRGPEPGGHRQESGGNRPRRQTLGRPGGGYGSDDRDTDRGLRGLVGSGTSQVNPATALRARDASRPSEDDLATAEETLTIVRRHWVPREDLPRR